jgi:hypothetical protein
MLKDENDHKVVIVKSVTIITDFSPLSIPTYSTPIPDEHKVTYYGVDMDDFIKKGGKLL